MAGRLSEFETAGPKSSRVNQPRPIGPSATFTQAAPPAGSRTSAAYAIYTASAGADLPVGDVVDRWRGRLPELRDRSMFLDVTENEGTGWDNHWNPTAFSGQGSIDSGARGQGFFHNFRGEGVNLVFQPNNDPGRALFIVDEGTIQERRVIFDQYRGGSVTQQTIDVLFGGLLPDFHTLRAVIGVDKAAGSTGYVVRSIERSAGAFSRLASERKSESGSSHDALITR